jgi:hypothetical protein
MTRYHSSLGPWGVDYPARWHVREWPAQGSVIFFQDDPDEGSSFAILPSGILPGAFEAQQVLETVAQSVRQRYPDFQIRVQGLQDMPGSGFRGQRLDAEASWTGARQQSMRGVFLVISLASQSAGTTTFTFLGGQAPAIAFDALRPVFVQMMQSFGGP